MYAVGAYVLWGFLPIYFIALEPTGAVEIVAWRILLSLVFCALLILVMRTWRSFFELLRDRRVVLIMGAAGALIFVNCSRTSTRRSPTRWSRRPSATSSTPS